jgi:LuxR family transcriptional regulator, maltose regulon positive regulatory protein
MTSTIGEPAVRSAVRDGRRQSRSAGLNRSELRKASLNLPRPAVSDKLRVPEPGVPLLHRPRISELLQQAADHRVSLICAPGGTGKTVACAMWAATVPDPGSIAWLSLDHGDQSAQRLWGHVRSALAATPGVPGEVVRALAAPGDDAFAMRLADAAERLPAPVTLVIDNISQLTGSPALPGLDYLLRNGPPSLRLLLCGRHPAGLAVARLRVSGELAEIGGAELACTAPEAAAYFAMLGIELPAARLDDLLSRTQGWMAGLRLAAMRSAPGRAATIGPITGDEPAVADYLRDEVLADLPADRRLFLLRTSVTEAICGDLADVLTGKGGGARTLDQLCRENLMISSAGAELGSDDTAYRYHPLMLDMLRAQLRRELPDEVAPLHRRAARWHASHGLHAEGIHNAAQAGDWDFAARVLAVAGPEMLLPGQAAQLEPVLATFPSGRFASDAPVAGALAAAGVRTGDSCAAALHLDNAASALARCAPAQRRMVTPWLQALRLMNATAQDGADSGLVEQSLDIAAQAGATACTAAEHQGLGLLWCALGTTAMASSQVADARERFAWATRNFRAGGHREFEDRARAWQALAEALYGDLLTADDLTADLAGGGAAKSDPLCARLAEVTAAHVHWARDESAAAHQALHKSDPDEADAPAGNQPRRPGVPPIEPAAGRLVDTLATMVRARLALGEGDQGSARNLLTRLRYQRLNTGNGVHQGNGLPAAGTTALDMALAPLDVDIALADSDLSRARLTLSRTSAEPAPVRPDLRLAQARVLLTQDDNQGALTAVEPCLAGPAADVTLLDHIRALITAAIARRRLGQADHAAEQLTQAMALAEPQGMFRPFLDGGAAARSVLTVLVRPASQGAAFAARILQRFDASPGAPGSQITAACAPLTSSELAVLRLLPSHMTNQEIAEALFLSINTVKTHLRSVYRKLGVTTRRQAISRGGRLGLLLTRRPLACPLEPFRYSGQVMRLFVLILSSRSGI